MRWGVPAGPCGSLEHDKSGLDVLDLCGDIGLVEHDHGLGLVVHIGCEAGYSSVLFSDGHNLEACWNDEGFDRFSTAKGGV